MKKLLSFLFTISIGAFYAMLFSQRSGKQFRTALKKSKTPGKDLIEEGVRLDLNALDWFMKWFKKSPTVKTWKERGSEWIENAKETGVDQKGKWVEKVKDLKEDGLEKVSELKEKGLEKASDLNDTLKENAGNLKEDAVKKIKTIAKK